MGESVEGGCLCGDVRYRIQGHPLSSGTCLCRTCRKASAAPVVPWLHVSTGSFSFTSGKPVEFHSSPNVTRTFCGRCGTPLTYVLASYVNALDVTTCSLDDPERFPPMAHSWMSHKLGWLQLADDLPYFEEGPPLG
ncbi:MAG TPA: GFA family protein [Candidatus Limnocylindrales bacterium]|nr:GFA family protein [Candidatus Limnocylindrales bacterium]